MLTEKEKLEEELRFLKESFEIGVITESEFEQGQKRIEKKMQVLGDEEEISVKEISHDDVVKPVESKDKPDDSSKEIDEVAEKIVASSTTPPKEEKKKEEKPETKAEEKPSEEIKAEDKSKSTEKKEIEKTIEEKEKLEKEKEIEAIPQEKTEPIEVKQETEKEEDVNGITENGNAKDYYHQEEKDDDGIGVMGWLAVIAIVVLLGAFGFWFFNQGTNPGQGQVEPDDIIPVIACSSDSECDLDGQVGTCENAGAETSECVYPQDVEVSLKVITAENCITCDTERVLSILNRFFLNLNTENLKYEDPAGLALVEQYEINALPAYIFDEAVVEAKEYGQLAESFEEVKGGYVLKNNVANANYYVDRQELPMQIDMFAKPGEPVTAIAEQNLEEFLTVFGDEVVLVRHSDTDSLAQELGINTFPTFLVNNMIKFNGVQSANTIKEYFCSVNEAVECEEELARTLV